MTYIPHKWVSTCGDYVCEVCGITEEQFDFIRLNNPLPSCTFGDPWWFCQSSLISQDDIDRARLLYEP